MVAVVIVMGESPELRRMSKAGSFAVTAFNIAELIYISTKPIS